jgi:hypothetical protein
LWVCPGSAGTPVGVFAFWRTLIGLSLLFATLAIPIPAVAQFLGKKAPSSHLASTLIKVLQNKQLYLSLE